MSPAARRGRTAPELRTLLGVKELDVLLRDHVTPVLHAEGFRKSGHTYRQTLPSGDSVIVGFHGEPTGIQCRFVVHVAFVPQPLLEMHNWSQGKRLDAPTQANWLTWGMHLHNQADPRLEWHYDSASERRKCIDELATALPRAVRGLRLLVDRDVLLDVVRAPVEPTSADLPMIARRRGGAGGFRMALLAERGPSEALQPFLDFYATGSFSSYADWAEARLAAGRPLVESLADVPQPRTMASYEPLQATLDAALDRFVTPPMAAAGFSRTSGGYERTTPAGDRAGVDIRLSATANDEALAFTVVTGLNVAPSAKFGRDRRPVHADSARIASVNPKNGTVSWLVDQVRPTPALASPVAALADLGLHPWSVPRDQLAEGMGLLARILAEANAPFLAAMLDRPTMLEFLQDPANRGYASAWTPQIRAALLVLDDEERTAELGDRLQDVRLTVGENHARFLEWVASREAPGAR